MNMGEYKEGDEKGIFLLWDKIFGNLLEKNDIFKIDRAWWNWRVLENPEGRPKTYLAFSKSGDVVAHHMIEKFKLCSENGETTIYQGLLTMADENNRGLILLKLLNNSIKDIVSEGALEYGFPNDEANQVYEKLGWKNVGDVPILGRPLNTFFKVLDLRHENKEYEIRRIDEFEESINELTNSMKKYFKFFIKRDYKTLNWKYAENPLKKYEKRIVVRGNKIEGYCVFRCGKFNGVKVGIILDIFSKDRSGFNALLNETIRYFSRQKMKFVSCYMINSNFFYKTLLKRGFIKLPKFALPKKNTFHVINYKDEDILNIKNWYLSYGDWDCV